MAKKKKIKEPIVTTWHDLGWNAEVVLDEDGGGWALSMTRDGDDEPVLVVPWVMGRNKKDPKPLNDSDFRTQVKAAQDFLTRSEYQRRTAFRRSYRVDGGDRGIVVVVFDVIPDDIDPVGLLTAEDLYGAELARFEVPPQFQLSRTRAAAWVASGFERPEV